MRIDTSTTNLQTSEREGVSGIDAKRVRETQRVRVGGGRNRVLPEYGKNPDDDANS